jgi:threonine dehydrogenase-like Zn-dependent dehydrogenase
MRSTRNTEPLLPTSNMAATNGKSKDAKKKVLVVGAGAAGTFVANDEDWGMGALM